MLVTTAIDRRIIVAAILTADLEHNHHVTTEKAACSPRCYWEYRDTPRARKLIELYEAGREVPVSQKDIWEAYHKLKVETKALGAGRIGVL